MATSTDVVIDYDSMSMDDLRKAAEEEARKASTQPTVEPVEEPSVEEPPADEPTSVKTFEAERTIDLGDGAGVQVFRGKGESREAALEELSNKLAEAQRNATKKIRELNAKVKPVEAPKISEADEALYSAELLKTPTEAFKKLFQQVTGIPIEDFKTTHAKEKELQAGLEKKVAADAFIAQHPEFADTERNGKLINKWCELHNDFSTEGLNKAYQDLNESGLLDVKGEEARVEQVLETTETTQRIVARPEVTPSRPTRKASGLSTQRRAVATTPATPTEDDMYALPLEELRKRANAQLRGQS